MDPRVLVVIGDLVGSRNVGDRAALQERFLAAVERCNQANDELLSPYTVTLGDEFQAVLRGAERVFTDLTTVQAELLGPPETTPQDPLATRVRFSLAVGHLTTPLNSERAIAMDGPAFHAARAGIERLKRTGDTFLLSGLEPVMEEVCNSALALVSHTQEGWHPRRHWVLAERMLATDVGAIADRLGVSAAAVYKNLTKGGVDVVCRLLLGLRPLIDAELGQAARHSDASQGTVEAHGALPIAVTEAPTTKGSATR